MRPDRHATREADRNRTDSPVLIIGTERSGSNLLRLMLNAHSQVAVPHPPHLMRYLAPHVASYGDLADPGNRARLVHDALLLVRRHIHPWPHPIDPADVVTHARPTLFGVVAQIYEQYRRAEGKARWGCKSTFMVDNVADVLSEYPRARFVWLVRDPRDVAASARRSVFGHCHPFLTAHLWAAQQQRAAQARDRWGPDVVCLLRYEDLVSRPREEVERLCDFLALPVEEAVFAHHRSAAARQIAGLSESWRNAGRPIGAGRVGAHRDGLTDRERGLVEAVTAGQMRELGYPVTGRPGPVRPPIGVRVRDLALRAAVECRSLAGDRNVFQRWARAATVVVLRLRARCRHWASRGYRSRT